ncbi:MAG: ABC transporter substrate-binding protein [Planctomycetota bacterium]
MRIVSLLPSATEILSRVGGRELLVGRSHECDFPAGLDHLPALTAQRTVQGTGYDAADPDSARAVDEQVRASMGAGQPLYTLDTELLAELRPDLILTQDLCDVCSIDLETVRGAARVLGERTGRAPEVLSLNPETVEGVLDDHLRIGRAAGLEREANVAVVEMVQRMNRAQEHVNPYDDGPVVGFCEWTDPVFVAGHWTVQLIERAGGRHPWNPTEPKPGTGAAVGPQQAERVAGKSIAVPPRVFAAAEPAWLIVAPCGLTLDEAEAEARRLVAKDWARDLPAVRAGRVVAVDGSAMFNRPGPRLVEALEWMTGLINNRPELIPDAFPWRPVPTG